METLQVKITKLLQLSILEDGESRFVCFSKLKVNDVDVEFEFTEDEWDGNKLKVKNQNGLLEDVEISDNLNYNAIEFLFTTSIPKYNKLNIDESFFLKFDKAYWEEEGVLEEAY